jgi:hypothetical protein
MNEYQKIVCLMKKSKTLEEFSIYSLMLVKYLKQTKGQQ